MTPLKTQIGSHPRTPTSVLLGAQVVSFATLASRLETSDAEMKEQRCRSLDHLLSRGVIAPERDSGCPLPLKALVYHYGDYGLLQTFFMRQDLCFWRNLG